MGCCLLYFSQYSQEPTLISHVERIGEGIRLLYDPAAELVCTVARSEVADHFGAVNSSLKISGANRKPEEWFGIEIDLTPETTELAVALRVFPALRLFPRIHFNLGNDVRHVDLADVAASDSFSTRYFRSKQWRSLSEWPAKATSARMLLLIPSTPWFILELAGIERRAVDDA